MFTIVDKPWADYVLRLAKLEEASKKGEGVFLYVDLEHGQRGPGSPSAAPPGGAGSSGSVGSLRRSSSGCV
jgi:hypothetical protein